MSGTVIVGAGIGGVACARELRRRGFDGSISLVSAEPCMPYLRPALSKQYLCGDLDADEISIVEDEWYEDNNVELLLDARAETLDLAMREVVLNSGARVGYDHAVLATGASARRLVVPGVDAAGVVYLDNPADADEIRGSLAAAGAVAIIGAGWVGLEVAASVQSLGATVSVIDAAGAPLARTLGAEMGAFFRDVHSRRGIAIRCGVSPLEVETDGNRVTGVRLSDGGRCAADLVVVAIGVQPVVHVAAAAGLDVGNGVHVDRSLRTSCADVFALGDVANRLVDASGARRRVEHWATAERHAAVAAAGILGSEIDVDEIPYFSSDQHDVGIEFVGQLSGQGDYRVVVRGEIADERFVALWVRADDRVDGAMIVNRLCDIDDVKPLIGGGSRLDVAAFRRSGDPFRAQ